MSGLPSIVFGIVAIGAALLALLLPDTSQAALPDDIIDAEKIDNQHIEPQTDVIHHTVSITQEKQ